MLPIGSQADFSGVVSVLIEAYLGDGKQVSDVPANMADAVKRAELTEAAAEADDALLEKYFETETLSDDEVREGIRLAARNADLNVVPVFVTSATHNIGVLPCLRR